MSELNATLPPFLQNTEPMEPEHLPLQVTLLTMEVAEMRSRFTMLSTMFALILKREKTPDPLLLEMAQAIMPAQMQEVNDASENRNSG